MEWDKVDDYVFKKNYIGFDRCNEIIDTIEEHHKWEEHTWYDNETRESFTDYKGDRKADEFETSYTFDPQVNTEFFGHIDRALHDYRDKYKPMSWVVHFSKPRFNRYKVGTNMQPHVDHISDLFDGNQKGIPIISLLGTLNGNYEGGEFLLNDKLIKFNAGDILLFPSNFMFKHEVLPVTKGTRYTWVSWAY